MPYQSIQLLSAGITAVLFASVLIGVAVYVLWPGNARKFERAARQPLDQDTIVKRNRETSNG
jgi:cbb3-type cytochrome oxidase subunit 3